MSLILDGTYGLSDVDGSAATPAIRGTDTNTGIFFPAADTIAFAEGGAEVARFDSSGNLGLGVTPSAWSGQKALEFEFGAFSAGNTLGTQVVSNAFYNGTNWIYRTSNPSSRFQQNINGHQWFNAASGTAGNAITFTQAMTLDASGNLGIGTTSPSAKLDVSGAVAAGGTISLRVADTTASLSAQLVRTGSTYSYAGVGANESWLYSQGASNLSLGPDGAGAVKIVSNGAERARFNSTGALVLAGGTTTANGIGITFPATQSASSNANTLDDYEEGSWTPAFGGFATQSYSLRVGSYIKIGRFVTLFWDVNLSAYTGSWNQTLTGLPFTISNNMAGYSVIMVRDNSMFTTSTAGGQLKGYAERGTSYAVFQVDNSGTSGFGTAGSSSPTISTGRSTGYLIYETAD
jgi:hypothetical protein